MKAEKDWLGVRWPKIAMHLQLPHFLVNFV